MIPVAIVGGGPVGLAVALDLGWYGVECVVIEAGDGAIPWENAKFVDINMRTMEYCRRWGMAGEVRERGFNPDYPQDTIVVTSLTGELLGRLPLPSFTELRTPPVTAERIARCPQTIFDPILKRTAAAFAGVEFRYQTRCDAVEQDDRGATLALTDLTSGKRESLRAAYVVCCQGAASSIRDALGIELEGAGTLSYNANVVFRSDELLKIHDKGPGFYTAIGPEGRWGTILAIDGRSLWRLQLTTSIDRTTFDRAEASALIRRFAGTDFDFEILSALVWARREAVAERYQDGRIFLAGDAAHQLSPSGGFGLNTGIGDATNLTWKLAATLAGWGGAELLASYEVERKPVGKRNVRAATGRWNANAEWTRETVQAMLDRANCGYEFGARYEDVGLQLGYRYDGSPLVVSDGTPPPPDDVRVYSPVAAPGARAPHYWLAENRSILDLFGHGFVLLRLSGDAPGAERFARTAAAAGLPLTVHSFDIPQLLHIYNKTLVLVRPDGHVAWRGNAFPDDEGRLIDAVRGGKRQLVHT